MKAICWRRRAFPLPSAARPTPSTARQHNGVFFGPFHNFSVKVDPYKEEGKKESGLLWGISAAPPGKAGQGDTKVQAYNFRMWLTDAADRLPFPKPAGYDRDHYALLLRYLNKQPKPAMPFQLNRGDCNNNGGFSTDYIGGADAWPEADYATREKIFQDHVNYQQGLMWFMANDPDVPEELRRRSAPSACRRTSSRRPAAGRMSCTSARGGE